MKYVYIHISNQYAKEIQETRGTPRTTSILTAMLGMYNEPVRNSIKFNLTNIK